MNGEVLPLFSQPVYIDTVQLDDSMIQDAINTKCDYVLHDLVKNNGQQSDDIQWLQSHPEVKSLCEEYLDHYVYNVLGISRQRHTLIHQSSWVNKHVKGDRGGGHSHTNSMFSGVLYFKVPPNSGDLSFHVSSMFPTYVRQTVLPDIATSNIYNMREVTIQPCEGMIIFFPSHLSHSIQESKSDELRYSMAFNYFMKGAFGCGDSELTL